MCERHGKGLIVDAMSSFGALPIDARRTALRRAGRRQRQVPGRRARHGLRLPAQGHARRLRRQQPEPGDGPARPACLHGARPAQWRFTPPTHVMVALAEAVAQFVEEGGQPARLARYTDNCRTLIDGMAGAGPQALPEARAAGADHRHLPRAGAPGLRLQALLRRRQAARLHPLPGQADRGGDLPRRLHRRHRPQRDAAGRERGGRDAARDGDRAMSTRDRRNTPPSPPCAPAARARSRWPAATSTASCAASTCTRTSSSARSRRRLRLLRRGLRLGLVGPVLRQHQVTGWQHGFPDALARLDLGTRAPRALGRRRALLPGRVRQCRRHALRRCARARR